MKKVFGKIIVFLLIVSSFAIFGCKERYGGLRMSLNFCFTSFSSKTLENGTKRWTNAAADSVVDENLDGSYTLYMFGSTQGTAYLDATFTGIPDDFNTDVQISLSNSILTIGKKQYIDGGIRFSVTPNQEGTTTLTVLSAEGDKQRSVNISVVEVPSALRFKEGKVAISYKKGTQLNLANGLENNLQFGMKNVSFELGTLAGEGETLLEKFVPYSSIQLATKNISLSDGQLVLLEDFDLQEGSVLYARATYSNPLGEDLVQLQQIEFLPQITNFEIYTFDQTKTNGLGEKVGDSDNVLSTINFVTNIAITHKDFVLKVNTNGKKLNVFAEEDALSPFEVSVQPLYENYGLTFAKGSLPVRYFNTDGEIATASNIARSEYALCFVRLIPSKVKSTEGSSSYPLGTYDMVFRCEYADYDNDEFATNVALRTKCYSVVNSYAAGDNILQNNNVESGFVEENCYETEVMTNFDASLGVKVAITVGEPLNVLSNRTAFGIKFYRRQAGSSTVVKLSEEEVLNAFQILINSDDNPLLAGFEQHKFLAGTNFYFKIKSAGEGYIGDDIFMQITSCEEQSSACCVVKLSIVQGISAITGYELVLRSREIDEITGDYVIYDRQNVVFENAQAELDLDLSKDYVAILTLSVFPTDATLSNIYVSSLKDNVVQVGVQDGKIVIDPRSVGKNVAISLGASNLKQTYSIVANVYYPVVSMEGEIVDISTNSSIGDYSVGVRNIFARVKAKEQVNFLLTTRPYDASRYDMTYAVYDISSGTSVQIKAPYTIYHDGRTSGLSKIFDECFELNCDANAFMFTSDLSNGKTYVIKFLLENLDGTTLDWTFTLSAYVPIEEVDINVSRTEVFDPKTVAYEHKLESGLTFDPFDVPENVFGFDVSLNKTSGRTPSKTFEQNATVTIKADGNVVSIFEVTDGLVTKTYGDEDVLKLLYPSVLGGKYWFELVDGAKEISTIEIEVKIAEYRQNVSARRTIWVLKHERVSEIFADGQTVFRVKDTDVADGINIPLEIANEKAYNKNLVSQNISVVKIAGENTYVVAGNGMANVSIENKGNLHALLNISLTGVAGRGIVVVLPQDKICSKEQFDIFCGEMKAISISENDFAKGIFYVRNAGEYEVAQDYEAGKQYYAKVVDYASLIAIWKGVLTIQIDVENGEDVPYSISTAQELLAIAQNPTKRYVLANNIRFDSSKTFSSIGAYYPVEISEEEFNKGVFYIKNNLEQYVLQSTFRADQTYYAYGFGGELSGKYEVQDSLSGTNHFEYYSIENVYLPSQISSKTFGLFETLYGKVSDVDIKFVYAQPNFTGDIAFGGIAGVNFGEISYCTANYSGAILKASNQIVFGALAGVNFGKVVLGKSQSTQRTLSGNVKIVSSASDTLTAGGIVGLNFGEVEGSFARSNSESVTFGESSYDSNIDLSVETPSVEIPSNMGFDSISLSSIPARIVKLFEDNSIAMSQGGAFLIPNAFAESFSMYAMDRDFPTGASDDTICGIGGAVGANFGKIANLSVHGQISAANCDFVGGIVGLAVSNATYNGAIDDTAEKYSISCSYASAHVTGHHYVGGVVGAARGFLKAADVMDEDISDIPVAMYDVGAENYVDDEYSRNFVTGFGDVGGFAGKLVGVVAKYLSVTSYYDEYSTQAAVWLKDVENYDVVATGNAAGFDINARNDGLAGGFAGSSDHVKYFACGANVNLWAETSSASFIFSYVQNEGLYVVENIFGKGTVNSLENRKSWGAGSGFGAGNVLSYSKVVDAANGNIIYYLNGNNLNQTNFNAGINAEFATETEITPWVAEKDASGNVSGLPMLYITYEVETEDATIITKSEPLFVLGPVVVNVTVKTNDASDSGWKFVRLGDKSLMLFFAMDEKNLTPNSILATLNTTKLLDILDINVEPNAAKANKLVVQSSSDLLEVSGENIIIKSIGKEGSEVVNLTIYSLLSSQNSSDNAKVEIILCYGLTDVNLYANTSFTAPLGEENGIDLLLSETQTIYANPEFVVEVAGEEVQLRAMDNVGLRFEVKADDVAPIVESLNGMATNIGNIFTIGSKQWNTVVSEGRIEKYYVNIDSTFASFIPLLAIPDGAKLAIKCVPYIYQTTGGERKNILLEENSTSFYLTISHGATSLSLSGNVQPNFVMNQLQTLSFVVDMATDSIDDKIILDNILDLGGDLGINVGDYKYEFVDNSGKVEIVGQAQVRGKSGLRKISQSFTVWFKDKLAGIKQDKNYSFNFHSSINSAIGLAVDVKIVGENEVKSVYTNIYADYDDFPQKSSGGYIYSGLNGSPAVLGVEVYPYVTNYSHVRLSYSTSSGDLLFMSPVTLDLKNEHGKQFVDNASVAVVGNDGKSITVDKSVGQDTFLSNDSGVYSYARSYFFKLFTDSTVAEGSQFVLKIEIINDQGNVILTKQETIYTLKKPGITFEFDESLLGDNKQLYYLPIGTKNELSVETINYSDNIKWTLSAVDERGNAYGDFARIKEALEPTKENGKYYVQVLNGEVGATDLVGKTVTLHGEITNNKQTYSYEIKFVVTLFTVKSIAIENADEGSLKVKLANTTPLKVNVSAYYDESINADGSWYDTWYENVGKKNVESDSLYKNLSNAGYKIKQYFVDYLNDLSESISKVATDKQSTISGVWKNNDGTSLVSGDKYLDETFGVEKFKDFFALYGLKANNTVKILFDSQLSYSAKNTLDSKSAGVANVCDYLTDSYNKVKNFRQAVDVTFVYASELRNAIPVSTAEEFLNMEDGKDYRLVNDIVLENYTPISTKIASFDGNNKVIFITSFSYNSSSSGSINLGLFEKIESSVEISGESKKVVIQNTTVFYTPSVSKSQYDVGSGNVVDIYEPSSESLRILLPNADSVTFGGIACTNAGVITNANVLGGVKIEISSSDVVSGGTATSNLGGLVATNEGTGYITNSAVGAKLFRVATMQGQEEKTYDGFDIYCYGKVGGFVQTNSGKIVASYFESGSIEHNSKEEGVGGFVQTNNGEILECYVQGRRSESDRDIRNTGSGIVSRAGIVGGFVYSNNGTISDCYSNIWLSSSGAIAGFVFADSASSVISRCYSISYKKSGDNNTTAYPFAGPKTLLSTEVCINGVLNDCFFLNDKTKNDKWENTNFYVEGSSDPSKTPANKKAVELSTANFATHTYFTNYDLSLVYYTDKYSNDEEYNYVDGYTWVIIEGKPVLASTLVRAISQRDYLGKKKTYSGYAQIFNLPATAEWKSAKRADDQSITDYSDAATGKLLFSKRDNVTSVEFIYPATEIAGTKYESLVITYQVETVDGKKVFSNPVAEYGADKRVLDIQESSIDKETAKDSNFRANDTIVVNFDYDNDFLSSITYYSLDEKNITYYYKGNSANISATSGSQSNPITIYDKDSLVFALTNTVASDDDLDKYFRIICDIDLDGEFLSTSRSNFTGVLQGNHMTINNLSMSYNRWQAEQVDKEAFGMFAKITSDVKKDTIISNLKLGIVQIVSNVHTYVGALAGIVGGSEQKTDKKVLFNNVSIASADGSYAPVQGRNVVGGLAGYVGGNVIIKDIFADVSVVSTFDAAGGASETVHLYTGKNSLNNCSYVGGVVGVFDATSVVDNATKKNFNASNITVISGNAFFGGVVGSAFGLLGANAIANYVNVQTISDDTSFIKSQFYAGGIIGENRGILLSSSVKNVGEDNTTVSVGKSTLAQQSYFFNGAGVQTVAIGGLVGLNNGGLISNSLAAIDVRSSRTLVAGGAVGRQLAGGIENVIVSGAVLGDKITGGLVGTFNDSQMMKSAEAKFAEEALMSADEKHLSISTYSWQEGSPVECRISGCVAQNNWLNEDYDKYLSRINALTRSAVSGFIGLISTIDNAETAWDKKIVFDRQSSYVGSISNGTTQTKIKAAFVDNAFDNPKNTSEDQWTILCDKNGEQAVFPTTLQELLTSAQASDISYSVRRIPFTAYSDNSSAGDEYKDIIYQIEGSGERDFSKDMGFFKEIAIVDLGNTSRKEYIEAGGKFEPDTWYHSTSTSNNDGVVGFDWFAMHFGIVYEAYEYTYSDGHVETGLAEVINYKDINNEVEKNNFANKYKIEKNDANKVAISYKELSGLPKRTITKDGSVVEESPISASVKFCYIATPIISNFEFDRSYEYKSNNQVANDIALFGTNVGDEGKNLGVNSYKTVEALLQQRTFVLNGIRLFDLDINTTAPFVKLWTAVEGETNVYKLSAEMLEKWKGVTERDTWFVDLPDGGRIVDVKIVVDGSEENKDFYVSKVILHYEYRDVQLEAQSTNPTFLKSVQNEENPLLTTYSLISSAKKVAFRSFDSGYWTFASDFYSGTVPFASKYPQNIEFAETYVWEDFKTTGTTGIITEIKSAEDLALSAYLVNEGNDYAGVKVQLKNNIDLSGKYWVPIGKDAAHAFKGTFDGNGCTIKYISVDENSFGQNAGEFAGLFGYLSGATIQNLTLLGGQTKGNFAGGLAGYANNDSTISGVSNRNNVIGSSYAGGLVGYAEGCKFKACLNYAEVKCDNNYDAKEIYVGGIAGKMNGGKLLSSGVADGIETQNNGTIQAQHTHNSHFGLQNLVSVWAGGIAGDAEGISIEPFSLRNYGSIVASSNASKLWVGGLFGKFSANSASANSASLMFNKGTISVSNSNRNTTETKSEMFVGGNVGEGTANVSLMSNEEDLSVTCDLVTNINVCIGGIAGKLAGDIVESYNAKNISYVSKGADVAHIGGIVGLSLLTKSAEPTIVSDCYNSGKISATCGGIGFVAGIVGANEGDTSCKLVVKNTLSIGQVAVQSGEGDSHVSAITNYTANVIVNPSDYVASDDSTIAAFANFFLLGSATLDGNTVQGLVGELPTDYNAELFAQGKISATLKDEDTYIDESNPLWNFGNGTDEATWEWKYSTWYPTLKRNSPNTIWTDSVEDMVQVGGDYVIDTAEQLAKLALLTNSGTMDTKGKTFRLRNAIDLSNKLWIPIGTEEYPFEGTLEGGGYSVYNLTVDGSAVVASGVSSLKFGGLLGVIRNSKVTNLGIISPIVKNVNNAAAVVAQANSSLIQNVYSEVAVGKNCRIVGDNMAGGIVCELKDSTDTSVSKLGLHTSYNNVPVEANTNLVEKTQYAGGLVASLQNSLISNCYNGTDGIVKISGTSNETVMIVGKQQGGQLSNVFNICTNDGVTSDGVTLTATPSLFEIVDDVAKKVDGEAAKPVFENLAANTSDGKKSTIWAREYSLNAPGAGGELYPSLRGVGLEWKNTECDSLLNFSTQNLEYKSQIRTAIGADNIMFAEEVLGQQELSSKDSSINQIYLISTPEELAWLSLAVNSGMRTSHCEFMLTSDINLSGRFFTPIGQSEQTAFCGVFNFNGHTISGLTIDNLTYNYTGLFGWTNNAYIINGYIKDAFVKVENSTSTANMFVGTVVGYANNTTIKNMTVATSILAKNAGKVYVGGVAGYVSGTIQFKMENVFSRPSTTSKPAGENYIDLSDYDARIYEEDATTSASKLKDISINIGGISLSERVFAGGIVGFMSSYNSQATAATLSYCTNQSNVVAMSVGSQPANVYGGGVAGYLSNQMTIEACQNFGAIKTSSTLFDAAGGIAGYSYYGTMRNCLSTGYVESCLNSWVKGESASGSVFSYIGGIVGIAIGGEFSHTISQSTTYQDMLTGKNIAIGGIIGYSRDGDDSLGGTGVLFDGVGNFGTATGGIGLSEPATSAAFTMGLDGRFVIDSKDQTLFSPTFWSGNSSAPYLKAQKAYVALTSKFAARVSLVDKNLNTSSPLVFEEQGNSFRGLLANIGSEVSCELEFDKDNEIEDILITILKLDGTREEKYAGADFSGTNEKVTIDISSILEDAACVFVSVIKKN